jgi:hypothetical protein
MSMNPQDVYQMSSTPFTGHSPNFPSHIQTYGTNSAQAHPNHSLGPSGEAPRQMEETLIRPPTPGRRHSLVDIRRKRSNVWEMETPPIDRQPYVGEDDPGGGRQGLQSRSRSEILTSPTNDKDFQPHGDATNPLPSNPRHNRSSPPSRRQSQTNDSGPGQVTRSNEHVQQHWQEHAPQSQYAMNTRLPDLITVLNDSVVEYNPYTQHVAVTTGPLTEGQGSHWG